MLNCSWIALHLSSQLPVVRRTAGKQAVPGHPAADTSADEREDEAEEDTDDHNSRN